MTEIFSNMILSNKNINGIIEIGGGNGELSTVLIDKFYDKYIIIDPSYTGQKQGRYIIETFVENVDWNNIKGESTSISKVYIS
jgi:hypothetical protein